MDFPLPVFPCLNACILLISPLLPFWPTYTEEIAPDGCLLGPKLAHPASQRCNELTSFVLLTQVHYFQTLELYTPQNFLSHSPASLKVPCPPCKYYLAPEHTPLSLIFPYSASSQTRPNQRQFPYLYHQNKRYPNVSLLADRSSPSTPYSRYPFAHRLCPLLISTITNSTYIGNKIQKIKMFSDIRLAVYYYFELRMSIAKANSEDYIQ